MSPYPTYADIRDQASSWAAALAPELSGVSQPLHNWVLAGSGASYYAAVTVAGALRDFGVLQAQAVPSSELWMRPDSYVNSDSLVIGLSRTGTTTETIQVLRAARERGAHTVGITLSPGTPVPDEADQGVVLGQVGERGRVMTRSFSTMTLAAAAMALGEVGARTLLEEVVARAADRMADYDEAARSVVSGTVSTVTFLGSGAGVGVAMQGALQLQETSELPAQAFPVLEYRHGPLASQDPQSLVVLISSARSVRADVYTAEDTALVGGRLVVCAPDEVLAAFPDADHVVKVSTGRETDGRLDQIAALPFVQLLAWHQTDALGKSSEWVRNLDRTVIPHVNPHNLPSELFDGPVPT